MLLHCVAAIALLLVAAGSFAQSYHGAIKGPTGRCGVYELLPDSTQGLIACVRFRDSVDILPGPPVQMLYSIPSGPSVWNSVFLKFDKNDSLLWYRHIEGAFRVTAGAVDSVGNIFATGAIVDSCDFDPGPGVALRVPMGGSDGVVLKLDANGDFA